MGVRNGVVAGGNWTVDRIKTIDVYPHQDALANVLDQTTSNGGAAYNVLKDLALLKAPFHLEAIGLIGSDSDGKRVLDDCRQHGIDTTLLKTTQDAPTSSTDVMSVRSTGRRTFFHQRGANALLRDGNFPFLLTSAAHLHLGYLLLLDGLDQKDPEYGTVAARVLCRAKKSGLTTSIDVVSEDSQRFKETVGPALSFTDICFMNEFEAERTSGASFASGPEDVASMLLSFGIRHALVIHTEKAGHAWCRGEKFVQPAVPVPSSKVVSTVGAGDAFAAGFLYGFVTGKAVAESLRMAVCAAACCIMAPGCSEGLLPMDECLEQGKRLGFRLA